jgi:hypothetical protein
MLMTHGKVDETLTLEDLSRRMALEASVFQDIAETFRRLLGRSREMIAGLVPNLQTLSEKVTTGFSAKEHQGTLKDLRVINFLAYEDTLVVVPEGFFGLMVPFIKQLTSAQSELFKETEGLLRRFETELSLIISNKDSRQGSNAGLTTKAAEVKRSRERCEKILSPYFNSKHAGVTRQKLGKIYQRYSDLDEAVTLSAKMRQLESQNSYTELLGQVNTVVDLMKLLHARMEDQSIAEISPQVARSVASAAYELGRMVELVSIHGFLAQSTSNSVGATLELLKNLTEN